MKKVPSVMPATLTPETVLNQTQVAQALDTTVQTVIRAGLPASYRLGKQSPRYIWGDVIAWLKAAA